MKRSVFGDSGGAHHRFGLLSRAPGVVHSVFSRRGGVSPPPFASLNVSKDVGDSGEAVRENLLRIKSSLELERLVRTSQVHGDSVRVVDAEALAGADFEPPVHVLPPADALVTDLKGVGLMIGIADCQAVFLVDPVRKAIGNAHCGWKGSVQAILPKTVKLMERRYGSRPSDLLACISPSLGPCCAEFKNHRTELPSSFLPFQVKPDYFDFWAISRMQLEAAGLLPENIETAGRCTVCGTRNFFSYRGEGKTGRMAAVLALGGEGVE